MKNKNLLPQCFPAAWMDTAYFTLIEFLMRKIYKKDASTEPIIKNITKSVIDGKQICEIKELSYDGTSTYIFEIKAKATDEYKESEVLKLTYPKGN